MLRSHRILCSCVPAPLFRISPPRYTFALPFAPPPLAAFLPVCLYPFALAAFPLACYFLCACSPQFRRSLFPTRISAARSLFPAHLLAAIPSLAISCAISACLLFPARPLAAITLLAVSCTHFRCTLAVSCAPACRHSIARYFLHALSPQFRRSLFPAHISTARSLFPVHPLTAIPSLAISCAPACRNSAARHGSRVSARLFCPLAVPSASRFLLCLALPPPPRASASPCRRSRARCRT
ncbi:hypothetical protein B0H13DRAFT_2357898 [Mycena leptocephala]|nr:hypothetical protein B0H13DRAFT_2357898 [Mycena leptocephala]